MAKTTIHPKKLFATDCLGALLTAVVTGIVLVQFESAFTKTLDVLKTYRAFLQTLFFIFFVKKLTLNIPFMLYLRLLVKPFIFLTFKNYCMPYQNISAKLTDAELLTITTALADVANVLKDKVVNLTTEERSRLYKMRNNRYSLAERSLTHAKNNPHLTPPYLSLTGAELDFTFYKQLASFIGIINSLAETVADTQMALGSEILQFCLPFYNSVKMAAQQNVPGSTSVYEDLNTFFDLPPRPEEDTETP